MNRTLVRSLAVSLVGASIPALAGCSSDNDRPECAAPSSFVMVVQATDNAPKPIVPTSVNCELKAAIEAGAPVSVVEADGSPVALISRRAFVNDGRYTDQKLGKLRTGFFNEVVVTAVSAAPKSGGVDALAALRLAGELSSGRSPVIAFVGPGLSDRGQYPLTSTGATFTPASSVVKQLGTEAPKLNGATIRWFWFGHGVGDQKVLAAGQVNNLVDVMTQVVKAGGGKVIFEPGAPESSRAAAPSGGFVVNPVPVEGRVVTVAAPPAKGGKVVDVFDGASQLGFLGDVAIFREPEAAKATAAKYATWLTTNPTGRVDITGTTASFGTPDALKRLSQQRADAFKALVVSAGGDAARVTAKGVGKDFPDFVVDANSDGSEIPAKAQRNRSVRVSRVLP